MFFGFLTRVSAPCFGEVLNAWPFGALCSWLSLGSANTLRRAHSLVISQFLVAKAGTKPACNGRSHSNLRTYSISSSVRSKHFKTSETCVPESTSIANSCTPLPKSSKSSRSRSVLHCTLWASQLWIAMPPAIAAIGAWIVFGTTGLDPNLRTMALKIPDSEHGFKAQAQV